LFNSASASSFLTQALSTSSSRSRLALGICPAQAFGRLCAERIAAVDDA